MSENPGLFCLKDHIGNTDDFKDEIKTFVPGTSVHYESAIKDVFLNRQPASCDVMFLNSNRAIYVEFKTYTCDENKNRDINYKMCDKIACTALVHHRFLKGTQNIPENAEFWIIGGDSSEEYISIMMKSSDDRYWPPSFS